MKPSRRFFRSHSFTRLQYLFRMTSLDSDSTGQAALDALSAGDEGALAALFERYRDRLARMVSLRMDRRVQGRVDPSDVLQDSFIEAAERLPDYLANPEVPPFVWMRFITAQKLLQAHRQHLGAKSRDAGREVSLYRQAFPEAPSAELAAQLVGQRTSPSQAAMRAELKLKLEDALNGMDAIDREVLVLRHFERLSRAETAKVLGIDPAAAGKRYHRALKRLGAVLREEVPRTGRLTGHGS